MKKKRKRKRSIYSTPRTNLALSAGHVVATLILLDAGFALRALLGVGQNPVRSLALVLTLLFPHRQFGARRRVVGLLPAAEAEHRAALAPHASRVAQRRLHYHAAILAWAEAKGLVDVNEARQRKTLVTLELLRG